MKQLLLWAFVAISTALFAQNDSLELPELSDFTIKRAVLDNISRDRDSSSESLIAKIAELETRIKVIDNSIDQTANVNTRLTSMVERVKTIEDIQVANQLNELGTYQGNYQTAVINLVSMERELQPLFLFQATKDFYTALGDVSNLNTYPGFTKWWSGYQQFVEKNKNGSPLVSIASTAISIGVSFATGGVVSGPVLQPILLGVNEYINSMGKNRDEAQRKESIEMMSLLTCVGQFNNDKAIIDSEWEAITHELGDLSNSYKQALDRNLLILKLSNAAFETQFSDEADPARRLNFLNKLSITAGNVVAESQKVSAKDWKNDYHYELQAIQALRLRFGHLTIRIVEHLDRYDKLLGKYQDNAQIGLRVRSVKPKLDLMKSIFTATFRPADYIQSATTMYKVN